VNCAAKRPRPRPASAFGDTPETGANHRQSLVHRHRLAVVPSAPARDTTI